MAQNSDAEFERLLRHRETQVDNLQSDRNRLLAENDRLERELYAAQQQLAHQAKQIGFASHETFQHALSNNPTLWNKDNIEFNARCDRFFESKLKMSNEAHRSEAMRAHKLAQKLEKAEEENAVLRQALEASRCKMDSLESVAQIVEPLVHNTVNVSDLLHDSSSDTPLKRTHMLSNGNENDIHAVIKRAQRSSTMTATPPQEARSSTSHTVKPSPRIVELAAKVVHGPASSKTPLRAQSVISIGSSSPVANPSPPRTVKGKARDVFEINLDANSGVKHKFVDGSRKHTERRQRRGEDCVECHDYYEAVGPMPPPRAQIMLSSTRTRSRITELTGTGRAHLLATGTSAFQTRQN